MNTVMRGIAGFCLYLTAGGAAAMAQEGGVVSGYLPPPRPKLLEPASANLPVATGESAASVPAGTPATEAPFTRAKLLEPVFQEPGTAQAPTVQAPSPATQVPAPVATTTTLETAPWYPWNGNGRIDRFWGEADYLLWWLRSAHLPPLVTTSPPGTPQNQAGVLGAPGTRVLFGGDRDNGGADSGGSIWLGYWLDDSQTFGIEANFFMLGSLADRFSASSNGSTILARPFVNALNGQQQAQLVAFSGLAGQVNATNASGLLGAGAWWRQNLFSNPCADYPYRLDALIGYRYLRLADDLSINENLISTDPKNPNFVPVGTTLNINDRFNTINNFNGLDLGLAGEIYMGRFVLGGYAKCALGVNIEELDINGSTRVTVPGFPPVVNPGGLLALASNIGSCARDRFAVVPEVGIKLGYQLTPRLRFDVGYDFLFWSEVVRAGNQIDTRVNPNLLPPIVGPVVGPLEPAPLFHGTSFWAQGISVGLELRF